MSQWEVDPNHRRKLLQLQKEGANKKCCDCQSPNPQWASPKFGIYICLECAGIHRSLGVHISFVRSITMDQFKDDELVRMEHGGNDKFNKYMSEHGIDLKLPQKIKYDNPIATDYKDKLTCEVDGKEWVEPEHPGFDPTTLGQTTITSTNNNNGINNNNSNPVLGNRRSQTPQPPVTNESAQESFFAKLGKANESKSTDLPPSQGGRYQGFGNNISRSSTNVTDTNNNNTNTGKNTLSIENLQNDPLGTLTKGWSMFSSAITQSVQDVQEQVIKPGYEHWQNGEISEESKRAASQFGQKVQETTNYGYTMFNNFAKSIQEQYFDENASQQPANTNNIHNTDNIDHVNDKQLKNDDSWEEF